MPRKPGAFWESVWRLFQLQAWHDHILQCYVMAQLGLYNSWHVAWLLLILYQDLCLAAQSAACTSYEEEVHRLRKENDALRAALTAAEGLFCTPWCSCKCEMYPQSSPLHQTTGVEWQALERWLCMNRAIGILRKTWLIRRRICVLFYMLMFQLLLSCVCSLIMETQLFLAYMFTVYTTWLDQYWTHARQEITNYLLLLVSSATAV